VQGIVAYRDNPVPEQAGHSSTVGYYLLGSEEPGRRRRWTARRNLSAPADAKRVQYIYLLLC